MLKTSAKILIIFILIVIVAVATGFVTYTLTRRIAREDMVETVEAAADETGDELNMTAHEASAKSDTKSEPRTEDGEGLPDCYAVRLEGTTLGVYVINDGKEEFLYHADVYKNDLSAEDLNLLQQGVELNDMSELTSFIENFTS